MTYALDRAIISRPLVTLDDAKAFFDYLLSANAIFHPEDDATEIYDAAPSNGGRPVFNPDDAALLNLRRAEAYRLDWLEDDCPCGYIMRKEQELNPWPYV